MIMNEQNYSTIITVNAAPLDAFKNINNVTKWWTENIEGRSQKLNDEFTVRFDDVHVSTQKLVEVVPNKKIVWLVTDSNLNFIENWQEWTNTKISFEIANYNNGALITFKHIGLVPAIECYDACSNAWHQYIHESLLTLINTGKGQPTLRTEKESAATKK